MPPPSHDGQPSSVFFFFTGVAIAVMGYSLYSHIDEIQQPRTGIHQRAGNETKLEDAIPLKALAYLIQSSNATIQNNAAKITIERAMSDTHLPSLIATCQKDQPIERRSQALTALQLLTQKEQHRSALLEAGALQVLVDALAELELEEMTQRYVAMAICDLIQGNDINKYSVIEMGILDSIQRILTCTTIRNNELKYWTLMILHQVSLSDPFPKVLVHQGFVGLLAKMARMTFGNTNMPKFCMQSLVRLVASVDTMESKIVLVELLDYNIVDLISVCLRGDDVELIYWAAGLMHEFVLKDVASNEFRAIKGIHSILAGLLSAEEMYISRVILRTIKFMAYGDETFRQGMVKTNIVKKIMHCLTVNDDDVRYWATLCVHAVASQVESHRDILTAPEFEILLELAVSKKVHAAIFVADILSLICCIWQNDQAMESHIDAVVDTLAALVSWDETEVQYNSAGALFNLMAMQDSFALVIYEKCHSILFETCVSSNNERVQQTCAKASLKLTIKYPSLMPKLISTVIEPLIDECITANQRILPIMMMQVLVATSKSSSSRSSPSKLSSASDEEILRTPEYINVSSTGVISSDHQLDSRVRGTTSNPSTRSRGRRRTTPLRIDTDVSDSSASTTTATTSSSSTSLISSPDMDPADLFHNLAVLYDQPYPDRVKLLAHFHVPPALHTKLAGSLCALRYFLENKAIAELVISSSLPVRRLVDGLVNQVMFPVVGSWCASCPQDVEAITSDTDLVEKAFCDMLQWVRRAAPSTHRLPDDTLIPSLRLYNGYTSRSLLVLRSLVRYASIRKYLVHQLHFIDVMTFMLQQTPSLTDHILTCLGLLIQSGVDIPAASLQRCVVTVWKLLLNPTPLALTKKTFWFYSRLILTCASRSSSSGGGEPDFVVLDVKKSTRLGLINQETCLEVRNDLWTFETVIGNHPAKSKKKACYQVVLTTDGLNQMGWITDQCQLDAEAGSGVGDDAHSYGYDGCRCKKWHGRHRMRKTNYGKTWDVGDVITCALDLELGEIRYYQNGEDLGVAFTKVDTTKAWYPAVSLSTGQGCEFLFGGPMDPLRDRPDGYLSIYELYYSSPVEDLADALGRMRVSSPPQSTNFSGPPLLYVEMTVVIHSFPRKIKFGWKNHLAPRSTLCLVYDPALRQAMVCHDTHVVMAGIAMALCDGDVLGLSYDQRYQFGFTLNGTLLALVRIDRPFLPYLPVAMGPVKTRTNYGQAPFRYVSEDPRLSMSEYLARLDA